MGNWKSEENIKYFIENSDGDLAKDFLEKFDLLVDGYTPKPTFLIVYLEKDEDINFILKDRAIVCESSNIENYKEMIDILENKGKNNYIFLFSIKPFQIRYATVSSEYNIIGCDRKMRIREQKLNQLLNE